jgi:hypothetical protein
VRVLDKPLVRIRGRRIEVVPGEKDTDVRGKNVIARNSNEINEFVAIIQMHLAGRKLGKRRRHQLLQNKVNDSIQLSR